MTASQAAKITLEGEPRTIPLNKLVLSQANVRRTKNGVTIEELASDIAQRRGLLQSLNVRPIVDGEGRETGLYEVPAGGRRFEALQLLVRQKRIAKTTPVPCLVRSGETATTAVEDSLAENTFREALHPLDQFRAFQRLHDEGQSEEEIAARFFVTPAVVRQRLKLAAVSPKLLDLYAAGELRLEQVMAFTVTADHARQERVWDQLASSTYKEAYQIRRLLTDGAVPTADKRAQFVTIEAYEAAGGVVLRDLFAETDGGGWLQDAGLLDRLVAEKLALEAENVRAEGWKWVQVQADPQYGYSLGLRRLQAGPTLSADEQASCDALQQEYASLEEQYADTGEDYPEEVDQRLAEIERMLEAFDDRPPSYDPAEMAYGGAFVSLDHSGRVRVECGYVKPEDVPQPAAKPESGTRDTDEGESFASGPNGSSSGPAAGSANGTAPADEDEGSGRIPERLLIELTAHRTLGLREALAADPDAAFLTVLHAMAVRLFYSATYNAPSCLEIAPTSASLASAAPGLGDTPAGRVFAERHGGWSARLPKRSDGLWEALVAFDHDSRAALFAHCASATVNAVHQPYGGTQSRAHADQLSAYLALDMADQWQPTVAGYLGQVTKAAILAAVREAKGEASAQLIDHLKKADMAREAERLLKGSRWLPMALRTPGLGEAGVPSEEPSQPDDVSLPAFLTDDAPERDETDQAVCAIAAE